jgi:hypothetical protein
MLVGPICSFVSRHRPYFGREDRELIAPVRQILLLQHQIPTLPEYGILF